MFELSAARGEACGDRFVSHAQVIDTQFCEFVSLCVNGGYDIENGDRIKIDIEATADCEGGGGFGSSCEVMMA